MGFDISGESGNYFRNNVWWWRPLWDFISSVCDGILSEEDITACTFNDGHLIDSHKTQAIVEVLEKNLKDGTVDEYEKKYRQQSNSAELEQCDLCKGTGQRNDEIVQGECNKCDGTGKVKPFWTNYPFSRDNVENFLAFLRESGGFRVY